VATETLPARLAPIRDERPPLPVWLSFSILLLAAPAAALAAYRPGTALVAFGLLALVFAAALRVQTALLILVASAPLEGVVTFSIGPGLTITKLAGLLCFASFALYAITSHRALFLDRSHGLVFGLLGLGILSSLQAEEFGPAVATTLRYGSFVALYVVVSQFVADQALQRRIAWTLSLSCAAAAALGLARVANRETFQASLADSDPNDFAFILATALPFTFWLLRERAVFRPVVFAMLGVISLAIFLSFSRGALVGLAAGAFVHVLSERRHIPILLLGALVALAFAVIFVRERPKQVETGLELKESVAQTNVEMRLDAWRGAINLTAEQPLLGVGPGNFQFHFYEATGRPLGSPRMTVVHNTYLDVAVELGVIGMVLFVLYLVQAFARLGIARARAHGPPGYAVTVRTALVIAVVAGIFVSEQYFAPFWLFGGLATALWVEGRGSATAEA
jgi:putative inorganic carbon (hco3(-)) transporter